MTCMKKTGRITPYNSSILLDKTGYVTYSVPKSIVKPNEILFKVSFGSDKYSGL